MEKEATLLLAESGLKVSVVNPRQIRDIARAVGLLAKTDTLDAYAITRFTEAVQPKPRIPVHIFRLHHWLTTMKESQVTDSTKLFFRPDAERN